MKWINEFSNSQIPYYIYKLNKGDSIIYNCNSDYNKSFIVLRGIIYILKIFTNQEIIPIAILNTNNIINLNPFKINKQNYYKIIALDKTYIISFNINKLKYNDNINKSLILNIIFSYELTLEKYERMNSILIHKHIKYRVIQLILFLCLDFGIINQKQVIIPFKLSQKSLAKITGSNQITINKMINKLSKNMLITYSLKKKSIFKIFLN
uniref:Global nitrogen transcriptional regulator n=1 Tax=Acrosorium ciliolatum TaxID=1550622 RepID=A0A1Z1M228_9FLOR|nr:global nitrogen transcriptional regulator [Acrosorium ciliolatum]ARW60086.1 global nitrogen transcriptional regulator [Acrosorium ciliolatum]